MDFMNFQRIKKKKKDFQTMLQLLSKSILGISLHEVTVLGPRALGYLPCLRINAVHSHGQDQ